MDEQQELEAAFDALTSRGEQKIRVGQVWQEKNPRTGMMRRIQIDSVGEEAYSHQPGQAEITQIEFTNLTRPIGKGRGMMAFGLRKNWILIQSPNSNDAISPVPDDIVAEERRAKAKEDLQDVYEDFGRA